MLNMTHEEVRKMLFRADCYTKLKLPEYFDVDKILDEANNLLTSSTHLDVAFSRSEIRNCSDVNHIIYINKDGNLSWRPMSFIHPVIYASLVNEITKENNWREIIDRFQSFHENEKIECVSLPSIDEKGSYSETMISKWKNSFELAQIENSLLFRNVIHTDIADCYSSLYTHSIPWALHTKEKAKKNRSKKLLGNYIDSVVQDMQNGQTNGIPQGSVLMDILAELILGYVDNELGIKINENGIADYKIIRYRDDYRIFTNSKEDGTYIIKYLSEELLNVGLSLNSNKTAYFDSIIDSSFKLDKIKWNEISTRVSLQISYLDSEGQLSKKKQYLLSEMNHLLEIHRFSLLFPNSSSINTALQEFYMRIHRTDIIKDYKFNIPILIDIMIKNPNTIKNVIILLSYYLENIDCLEEVNMYIDMIQKKMKVLSNTSFMEIWLQRISILIEREDEYESKMCKKVQHPKLTSLWNSDWLKKEFDDSILIDIEKIGNLKMEIEDLGGFFFFFFEDY